VADSLAGEKFDLRQKVLGNLIRKST
jgi:hypothetical protein